MKRFVPLLVLAGALVLGSGSAGGSTTAAAGVQPNPVNMVDCNGLSREYSALKPTMQALCTDPVRVVNGHYSRAYDNGSYLGHDEPSVKFISSAPGSGSSMTYFMKLAVDPKAKPTANGSVTDYAELSIAPWFGLPMCDPRSYPQNPCKPASDTNTGMGAPTDAGSAFLELQFYPPGFGPFKDAFSCDQTRYCAALTIDSLECNFNFAFCNNDCIEPVNFAYIQRNGVPTGPPNSQEATDATFAPNAQTLMMNQGDSLRVQLSDTPAGILALITDFTTGQTGFMLASAFNGFMNTDLRSCAGTPFNFHPEYDTARQQNQVPWAALEGGVLMQQEIGHFESCDSVANPIGIPFDPAASWNCVGGVDDGNGEGPCDFTTNTCVGATTEGGGPCTAPPFTGLCEYSDAFCFPQGSRQVEVNGWLETWTWAIAACEQDFTQNGDLDFDGNSYRPFWPDGSPNRPTPFFYTGPLDRSGRPYPSIQFETNVAASENDCNTTTGAGCTALPHGAAFYPFWTLGRTTGAAGIPGLTQFGQVCAWSFGNRIAGVTTQDFGGTAEYGVPNVARFAGTLTSPVIPNPQLTRGCGA